MTDDLYKKKTMCAQCPFNKEGKMPGYIGPYETVSELLGFVRGEMRFPCHMEAEAVLEKQGHRKNDDEVYEKTPQCAGAMQFMRVEHRLPRDRPHAAGVKAVEVQESCVKSEAEMTELHDMTQIVKRMKSKRKS